MKRFTLLLVLSFTLIFLFQGLAQSGYLLDFDGVDYITVSNLPVGGLSAFTIEAWVKLDRYSTNPYAGSVIFTKEWIDCNPPWLVVWFGIASENYVTPQYRKKLDGSLNLGGTIYSVFANSEINLNTWYHVSMVWTGSQLILYVNGNFENSASAIGIIQDVPTVARIGERLVCGPGDQSVDGMIDEVRFWSTALTQAQIQSTMYTELTGTELGLYAYWNFNEGSGQTAGDSSPNNFDGMLGSAWSPDVNDPIWTFFTPPVGNENALDLDGIDDYVSIADDPSLNPQFITVSTWIKFKNTPSAYNAFISKYSQSLPGYLLETRPDGGVYFFICNTYGSIWSYAHSNTIFYPGQWYHVAGTYDGIRARIYVNGKLEDTGPVSENMNFSNSFPLQLAARPDFSTGYFPGYLDEARIYNRALSQAEIMCTMNDAIQNPQSDPGLVAYYKFNQSSGTLLPDLSVYDNDGTLINMDPASDWVESSAMVQNTLDFDGIDDHIIIAPSPSLTLSSSYTVETWFFRNSSSTFYQPILDKGIPGLDSDIEIYVQVYFGNYWLTVVHNRGGAIDYAYWPAIPADQWVHIAVRYSGGIVNVFIDGVYVPPHTHDEFFTEPANVANPVKLGIHEGASAWLNGQLDEVRIWNVSRTEDQIRDNMYKKLDNPAGEINLVAYYQFDQLTGTLLPDLSSYGNHGTLTGMDPANDWITSTVPMPYKTSQNGNWNDNATWIAGQNAPVNSWASVINYHDLYVNTDASTQNTCNCHEMHIQPGINYTVTGTLINGEAYSFILESTEGGTASLLHNTDNVEATYNRFNTGDVWHFVSPPISDGLAQIYHGKYLQRFDEPSNGYSDIIPDPTPLEAMVGYALYTFGDWTSSSSGNFINGAIGYENNLTRSGSGFDYGWNLVGNPYPSAIDWNSASGWTKSNINTTVYIENNGNWATWNGSTGVNGGSRYIASGQGFFVEVTEGQSSGTLMMNNDVRLHYPAAFLKNQVGNLIRLVTTGNDKTDETVILFNNESSHEFDAEGDAHKLFASSEDYPQLYSLNQDERYSIQVLPETTLIPLGFKTTKAGIYKIGITENSYIGKEIYLEDITSQVMHPLSKSGSYSFRCETGNDTERFRLHFLAPSDEIKIYSYSKTIFVQLPDEVDGEISIYNLLGQKLVSTDNEGQITMIRLDESGAYVVTVRSCSVFKSQKVIVH